MSTILVVEDEAIIARDILTTLESLGYGVLAPVASGEEALAAVAAHLPDLVLMDIRIHGELDGVETATLIRDRHGIPVVYLTSHSDESTLARATRMGAYGFILKPFNDRDLRTAVEVALKKRLIEERLAAQERWFAATLRSVGDAIIATDSDQRITFMNAVAERITGWRSSDAVGKDLLAVLRLVDEKTGLALESPLTRALREGFAVELPREAMLSTKGGVRRAVDDSAAPIFDDGGKTVGGVVVFRDVTERRQLEDRLAHVERLAALGTLSAGMAHEINNPLQYVLSNVSYALEGLADIATRLRAPGTTDVHGILALLPDLVKGLVDAHDGGERIRRIVADLRKFGRFDLAELAPVELSAVLDAAIRMTESTYRHRALIRRAYGVTPLVEANEGQLGQVFVNLLVNAVQAHTGPEAECQVQVSTSTDDDGRAVVAVRDDGAGMSPEVQARMFEPFFTTKPVGQGTGLGLSIVHTIVRSFGGDITVESEQGRGTTFRVSLPPMKAVSATERPPPGGAVAPARTRVLVIDDEPAIGRAVARMLVSQDEVVVCQHAHEALARFAAGERFDVVLCDLMMPVVDGIGFLAALSAMNPEQGQRVVFITGGATSEASRRFLETTTHVVMIKPIDPAALRRLVLDYAPGSATR